MSKFWRGLEDSVTGCAVAAVWRTRMGAEFDACRAAFFQPMPERAESYPCPLDCGCAHRVVQHSPTHLEAVCDCEEWGCPEIPLQPEDLVIWQLSLPRLGRALVRALDIDRRERDLGLWGTLQIGAWSADAVPVILALSRERPRFRHLVAELVVQLKERFILFAPTSWAVDASIWQMLAGARAGFFPLETTVGVASNGELRPLKRPGELFVRWMPQAQPSAGDSIQKTVAILRAFDAGKPLREAPLLTVFRLYCVAGLSAEAVAERCGCSKGTVINRLSLIEERTGVSASALRTYSAQFEGVEQSASDYRARRIHRRSMLDDPEEPEE